MNPNESSNTNVNANTTFAGRPNPYIYIPSPIPGTIYVPDAFGQLHLLSSNMLEISKFPVPRNVKHIGQAPNQPQNPPQVGQALDMSSARLSQLKQAPATSMLAVFPFLQPPPGVALTHAQSQLGATGAAGQNQPQQQSEPGAIP